MLRVGLGVRIRVLAIALVPSLALVAIGVGGAGYLVIEARHQRQWADALIVACPMSKKLVSDVQQERGQALARLAGAELDPKTVAQTRARLDDSLRAMTAAATGNLSAVGPQNVSSIARGFVTVSQNLAAVRTGVDANTLPVTDAYNFYGHLLDIISIGSRLVATSAPNPEVAVETMNAVAMESASEAVSRASALAQVLLEDGTLQPDLALEFTHLVGAYRANITAMADGSQGYAPTKSVVDSPAWTELAGMENVLLVRAMTPVTSPHPKSGAPPPDRAAQRHPAAVAECDWRDQYQAYRPMGRREQACSGLSGRRGRPQCPPL